VIDGPGKFGYQDRYGQGEGTSSIVIQDAGRSTPSPIST